MIDWSMVDFMCTSCVKASPSSFLPWPRSGWWYRHNADSRDRCNRHQAFGGLPRKPSEHMQGLLALIASNL
jgi:hypothetical protein